VLVVEATAKQLGYAPGYALEVFEVLLLPAAQTRKTPRFQALSTALCRVVEPLPPRLRLIAFAPLLAAKLMPFAT